MANRRVSRHTIRHVMQGVGVALAGWALLVVMTEGFTLSIGGIQFSSHKTSNPMVAAALVWLMAVVLARPETRRTLADDARWWLSHLPWASVPGRFALLGACALAIIWSMFDIQQWAGARPLWLDEQMVALNLRERSVGSLAGPLWLGQSAPYGWLVLERMALVLLGDGESALRLVPLAFGVATLATAVWIARRWMSGVGSLVLVVLCATGQWVSFYTFELKHYSADVFWGLWLPALAAWAIQPDDQVGRGRRVLFWWLVAAAGQWTANGALFVTPACAVIVMAATWRRLGWRALQLPALGAVIWALSFGLHYWAVIRHTLNSEYLAEYWAFALPPTSAGVWDSTLWVAAQLGPLAEKPGGTGWVVAFWLCATAGWVLRRRGLGLMMAAVPATACLLAMARLVPLFERLTLWAVPAAYVGIALAADHVLRPHLWRSGRPGSVGRIGAPIAAATLLVATGLVVQDLVRRGYREAHRNAMTNHSLDDRDGVITLTAPRRDGDVVVTTRLALPAIWWYARVPVGGPEAGARFPDGTPILEATYTSPGPRCHDGSRLALLTGRTRALVYLGFRFDDVPDGFDQLLINELSTAGTITAIPRFRGVGFGAILDVGDAAKSVPRLPPIIQAAGSNAHNAEPVDLEGCVSLGPARRW